MREDVFSPARTRFPQVRWHIRGVSSSVKRREEVIEGGTCRGVTWRRGGREAVIHNVK